MFVSIPLSTFNSFKPINYEKNEDSAELRGFIISILDRFNFVKRVDKANNPLEFEYMSEIAFTRGQTVLFEKRKFLKFKNFINSRKIYLNNSLTITAPKTINIENFFLNDTYSSKIFIRDLEYKGFDFKDLKGIEVNTEKLLKIINHLNSTKFSINKNFFKKIIEFKNKNITYFKDDVNKKIIDNLITECTEIYNDKKVSSFDINIQKLFSNMAIFNLMQIQIERILKYNNNVFFLNHRLDSRMRIYVYN
jgi:hypothetical protein